MFKTLICTAGLMLAATTFAKAEIVDLSTVKCSELGTMSDEEGQFLMVWLYGYYGGKAGDTTIDTESGDGVGKAIGEACAAAPEVGIMPVIDQLIANSG
jgi:acid stress chaperone HdeB